MATFEDEDGRSWSIRITVGVNMQLKSVLGIDLTSDVAKGDFLERLSSDPMLLCSVLYVVLEKQIETHGLDEYGFASLLGGEVIDRATVALLEGIADFFPKSRRDALKVALRKMASTQDRWVDAVTRYINGPEMEAKIAKALEISGETSSE